jgi:hypothetical protein
LGGGEGEEWLWWERALVLRFESVRRNRGEGGIYLGGSVVGGGPRR